MASIGESVVRIEDARLLRGAGEYLDDRGTDGVLYGSVVRSVYAHAKLASIDTAVARSMPGVVDVFTGADLASLGIGPIMPNAQAHPQTGEPFHFDPMPILATETVRYVGEPVAFVVAQSRNLAADAAAAVEIDYIALDALASLEAAGAVGAPQLSDDVPGNLCLDWRTSDGTDIAAAFAAAAHVVRVDLHNHRILAQPMEPRGAEGEFDSSTGDYLLTLASQNLHSMRDHVTRSLMAGRESDQQADADTQQIPLPRAADARVRVRARDVGGGFGSRNFVYPEYVMVLVAAHRAGRPVRWVATRSEGCISDHQARDVKIEAALALNAQGQFLALKTDAVFSAGAYMTGVACGVPTGQYLSAPTAVYDIPLVDQRIRVLLSNTVPIGVTRGPGFAETVDPIERLIDKAAFECGFDRVQLRRSNLVSTTRMPWTNVAGTRIDSGDFKACLEGALTHSGYAELSARKRQSVAAGRLRGYGLACHIKGTGGAPEENVSFSFRDDAMVFTTGTQAIGQGHETSFRQICTHLLGLPPEQIEYRAGDTDLLPIGGGHGSSRATYMASMAMSYAASSVIAKGKVVAAQYLEAALADIEFVHGSFAVKGTDKRLGLLEVAAQAQRDGHSLDTYQHTIRDALTWPNGCHVAELEVDPQTGEVFLLRYTAVDDHGTLINPLLVQGQAHGAIMQGAAQALMEQAHYDASSAQPLTGSFLDYAMPRAMDFPHFDVSFSNTPCTTNPLGVKGAGEPGAIAGYPAVANAIADAIGVAPDSLTGAASAFRVWQLLRQARADGRVFNSSTSGIAAIATTLKNT